MPASDPVLLMTRPRAQAERFVASLGVDLEVIYAPLIGIEVTGPLPSTDGIGGLIFTSAQGVEAWTALGGRCDLPAFVVGKATAQAAKAAGFRAQSADGDADALIDMIKAQSPQTPLLHARGTHGRGQVADRLSAVGIPTREAVLYDQPAQHLTTEALAVLAGDRPVIAPLFSPRTASLLAKTPVKAPLLVAVMSEAVALELGSGHTWDLRIASRPDSEAMQQAVLALLDAAAAIGKE